MYEFIKKNQSSGKSNEFQIFHYFSLKLRDNNKTVRIKKSAVLEEGEFQSSIFHFIIYIQYFQVTFLDEYEFNFLEINPSLSCTVINRCYYIYENFVFYYF